MQESLVGFLFMPIFDQFQTIVADNNLRPIPFSAQTALDALHR